MTDKICPICNNIAPYRLTKGTTEYNQCGNCKTLFCGDLPNDGMVGGGNEVPRNVEQNHLRIARINELSLGMKKEEVFILDAGCGSGMLIKDLKEAGYPNVDGWDAYNPEFSRLPEKDKYHICTCIEMVEHTSSSYLELDVMHRALKKNGIVIFETSFIDIAKEEGIELEDFFYINADVGHSTVFSHWGFDLLMAIKKFVPIQHWNRNTRGYQKISK